MTCSIPEAYGVAPTRLNTGLRPPIERAGLSGPDLPALVPAFAGTFDAWVDQVAGRSGAGW